jgi:hypothetical protein
MSKTAPGKTSFSSGFPNLFFTESAPAPMKQSSRL